MDICNLLNTDLPANISQPCTVTAKTTKRPFHCVWKNCSKAFTRRSDLCRHTKIHSGERPFPCTYEDCAKKFIQRSALTVHLRTHSGERPHVCNDCQKTFADSSSLARHKKTHLTNNRPFSCHCGKSFTRKSTLSRHQAYHLNNKTDGPHIFVFKAITQPPTAPKHITKPNHNIKPNSIYPLTPPMENDAFMHHHRSPQPYDSNKQYMTIDNDPLALPPILMPLSPPSPPFSFY